MNEIIYVSDLENPKNIDEYIDKIVFEISYYHTYMVYFIDWFNKDWLIKANERREKYKDCEEVVKTLYYRNYFIKTIFFEPKRYEYFIYVRAFLDVIKIYLQKNNKNYKDNKAMWKSSKYLEYYVHLIFKTGLYKNTVFASKRQILEELRILLSFLSKPLHAFSFYYNNLNDFKDISFEDLSSDNKEILNSINILISIVLNFRITKQTIKYPIIPGVDGNKQEYLMHINRTQTDIGYIKDNLNFWQKKCLEEFDNKIEEYKKINIK